MAGSNSENWSFSAIRGPGDLSFTAGKSGFSLETANPGFAVASVFRREVPGKGANRLALSFHYRSSSGFPLNIYVSSGTGWAVPSARTRVKISPCRDYSPARVDLDIGGVGQGRGVWVQFFIAGSLHKGQDLELNNIKVDFSRDDSLCGEDPVPAEPATGRAFIKKHVIHVHGKPFFPIGIYHASPPVLDIINQENRQARMGEVGLDRMLAQVAERGFNTINHSWKPGTSEYYRQAERYGLVVVSEVGKSGPERVGGVRKMTNALGWYGVDEPLASNVPAMSDQYRAYKKADPEGLFMTALDNGAVGFGCARFLDVAMPNYYPVSGAGSDLSMIAVFVSNSYEYLCKSEDMAVVPVVQLFTCDGERWQGFSPTYDQVRAQAYTALCAGAKGLFYYAWFTHEPLARGMELNPGRKHWFLPESPLWDRIGELNREVSEISDALLSGQTLQAATNPGEVMFRLMEHRGKYLLLAVNPTGMEKKNACLKLEDVEGNAKRLVPGPEMSLTASGSLRGNFKPYSACAYEIIPE